MMVGIITITTIIIAMIITIMKFLQEPNDTDLTKVDMDWFEEQVWK